MRSGLAAQPSVLLWPTAIYTSLHQKVIFLTAALLLAIAAILWLSGGHHTGFYIINGLGSHLPDSVWAGLTLLGDTRVSVALLLFFIYRYPQLLPAAVIASIPTTILTNVLKKTFHLPRPDASLGLDGFHQIGEILKHGSFPSGHSATIGVFTAVLLTVCTNKIQYRLLLGLMLLVGTSRVMVGAHFPVDVLVGMAIGLIFGYLGVLATKHAKYLHHPYLIWSLYSLPVIACYMVFQHDGGYPQGYLFAKLITIAAILTHIYQRLSDKKT